MKVIFEGTGTGKQVAQRFAKEKKRKRKANDPAVPALESIATSVAAAGPADRVHVVVAVAEVETEPLYKADISIIAGGAE